MKRITAFILCMLLIMGGGFVHAENVDSQNCTVTWKNPSGKVRHMCAEENRSFWTDETETVVAKGHVITVDDLPEVHINVKESPLYHLVWTPALGTQVNEDVTFTLLPKATDEGFCAVLWTTHMPMLSPETEPDYTWEQEEYFGQFATVSIFPKGHVIREYDLPYVLEDFHSDAYEFHFKSAVGTTVETDMMFEVEISAREEGKRAVCYMPTYAEVLMDLDGMTANAAKPYVRLVESGHVIQESEKVSLINSPWDEMDNCHFYYEWHENDVGKTVDDDMIFYSIRRETESVDIKFVLDDGTLVKEYEGLKPGTVIKTPDRDELETHFGVSWDEDAFVLWKKTEGCIFTPDTVPAPGDEFNVRYCGGVFVLKQVARGDANEDGLINTADAVRILMITAYEIDCGEFGMTITDVNKDNEINTADAVTILRQVAGMD